MRERVSILMVIFVQFGTSYLYSKPLFRALFPHFRSASRRFPTWLGFYFANSELNASSMGCASEAPASGEGITPTSYHLEVLRYSQPSEPQMWGFLRFALRIAAAAAAASGACLPALPTALSPPTSSCQIVDAICIYPFSLLRRICWGSHFFQRSG